MSGFSQSIANSYGVNAGSSSVYVIDRARPTANVSANGTSFAALSSQGTYAAPAFRQTQSGGVPIAYPEPEKPLGVAEPESYEAEDGAKTVPRSHNGARFGVLESSP